MFLLIARFRDELGGDFELTEPVREFLKNYEWPGNIRELRNVVEYFIYTGHRKISMEDLPPTVQKREMATLRPVVGGGREKCVRREAARERQPEPERQSEREMQSERERQSEREETGSDSFWFVLEQLYEASEADISVGRDWILKKAKEVHMPLSQQEVRNILANMADRGLARVSRGRGGSRLMPEGRKLWEMGRNKEGH